MKKEIIENLLVKHPSRYKKIRRVLFNLYRPTSISKNLFIYKIHPITYIMLIVFIMSFMLYLNENTLWPVPFTSGWIFIVLTWIYFKFQPQTWDEMYDYEKNIFRGLNSKPIDWEPKL